MPPAMGSQLAARCPRLQVFEPKSVPVLEASPPLNDYLSGSLWLPTCSFGRLPCR
jgi:hypothetical protein